MIGYHSISVRGGNVAMHTLGQRGGPLPLKVGCRLIDEAEHHGTRICTPLPKLCICDMEMAQPLLNTAIPRYCMTLAAYYVLRALLDG
jgi:hypothetical protein